MGLSSPNKRLLGFEGIITAADSNAQWRFVINFIVCTVPLHAITISLLPEAAFPASVVTATYPIQLEFVPRIHGPVRHSSESSDAYKYLVTSYLNGFPFTSPTFSNNSSRLECLQSPTFLDAFSELKAS